MNEVWVLTENKRGFIREIVLGVFDDRQKAIDAGLDWGNFHEEGQAMARFLSGDIALIEMRLSAELDAIDLTKMETIGPVYFVVQSKQINKLCKS